MKVCVIRSVLCNAVNNLQIFKMELEDTICYWLFPSTEHNLACAASTLAEVYSHVSKLTEDWVWHRQGFALREGV